METRTRLGLRATDPLSAMTLAEHLGFLVRKIDDIPNLTSSCFNQLTVIDPSAWSAATIITNQRKLVIVNSAHSEGRQSNNIMHELSHIICGHTPSDTKLLETGMMIVLAYDEENEEEADLLSATLLLPRVALIRIMEGGLPLSESAELYAVSVELLKMRLQRAGVYMQFQRRRY